MKNHAYIRWQFNSTLFPPARPTTNTSGPALWTEAPADPSARPHDPAASSERMGGSHGHVFLMSDAHTKRWEGRRRRSRRHTTHTPGAPAAQADMASPQLYAQQSTVWVRDVTEEGIEPHPGPRYLSKNVNSLLRKGKLYDHLKRIRDENTRTPITAVFIQDHRFPQTQEKMIEKKAKDLGLLAITAHSPPHPNTRVCYGGTMIVIPHSAIERKDDKETLHAACDRIKNTRKRAGQGRYVSVVMKVENRARKLTAAYAPANPTDRPNFFNIITPRLLE